MSRGGKRKRAGRNPSPYKTKTVSFRVRVEWVDDVKSVVKSKVEELLQNSTQHLYIRNNVNIK